MKKGISAAQASVIAAMRSGFKLRYTNGLHGAAWLNNTSAQRVTSSAFALERAGYIERFNHKPSGFEFRLTEKAKALP